MTRITCCITFILLPFILVAQKMQPLPNVKICFVNTVNHFPLVLDSVMYTNPFAENYTISKLKYYISSFFLSGNKKVIIKNSYYLIDERNSTGNNILFFVPPGRYNSISFLLGVDSIKNVSGAQSGALDPANDMFWTWNTGYVMAKLEGRSTASKVVNNKVEYHIGGFAGTDNVLKTITMPAVLNIKKDAVTEIVIEADINTWWQMPNNILIAQNPVCTTPGVLAKKIAGNYSKMFSLKKITAPNN